jgi:hypothetical protein
MNLSRIGLIALGLIPLSHSAFAESEPLLDQVRTVAGAPSPELAPAPEAKNDFRHRFFYESWAAGLRTAPGPWPPFDAPASDPQIRPLQKWLLANANQLETWPPRFADEKQGERAIGEWQSLERQFAARDPLFLSVPTGVIVRATFWMFGHNIDEGNAGEKGLRFLSEAAKRFPDSAVPPLLRGLLNLRFGGKSLPDAAAAFGEALKKPDADTVAVYLHAGLANRYLLTCQPNRAVLEYATALRSCADCLGREVMQGLGGGLRLLFSHPVAAPDKALVGTERGRLTSPLLGFSFEPPPKWLASEGAGGAYDPTRSVQSVNIPAAPTANGLEHALSVFAWVNPGPTQNPTVDQFIEGFGKNSEMVSFRKIAAPVSHPMLADWYAFDSRSPVGNGDTISGFIVRSKLWQPQRWSKTDHEQAAKAETTPCPNGPGAGGWTDQPDKTNLYYRPQVARLDAPLEVVFIYSGSRGTHAYAESSLRSMMSSLIVDNRAGSALLP